MPRYGVGVGFDFIAEDDEHAQDISNEIQALIKEHYAVERFSVNQIEAWPECQDCPEPDYDWDDDEGDYLDEFEAG